MQFILNTLNRSWSGDLPLVGYAGLYILANIIIAVLSIAVLMLGVTGAMGTGLLMSTAMIIGSAVACSGLIGAVLFARGLFVKQSHLDGIARVFAWLILLPHSVIALAAAAAFLFLGVGTIQMLWGLWFGAPSDL